MRPFGDFNNTRPKSFGVRRNFVRIALIPHCAPNMGCDFDLAYVFRGDHELDLPHLVS